MKSPVYRKEPIGSIEALSKALLIKQKKLTRLANHSDEFFLPNKPEKKANGGTRQTYTVKYRLKILHHRIKREIFYNVDFPEYLQGGIKSRDYLADASLHVGSNILICEDISDFFPSIRETIVLKMWQRMFHFPYAVANCLTQLTTYRGFLPQGAITSSYIANLVFWDREPQLVEYLEENEFCYSRYIDDITISANRFVSKKQKEEVIAQVYGMLLSTGVQPNRKKHKIRTRNRRMEIHGTNINSSKLTMSKKKRNNIRRDVKQCEVVAITNLDSDEFRKLYASTRGKVMNMARLHPREARKYIKRLDGISP